jgi:adenylate kinase
VKVLVHGPPASGKTALSQLLAQEYSIHYVNAEELVKEALEKDAELAKQVHDHSKDGKPSEDIVTSIIKKKLQSWPCQNQGYVLDGYPANVIQAELLFLSGMCYLCYEYILT